MVRATGTASALVHHVMHVFYVSIWVQLGDSLESISTPGALQPTCPSRTWTVPTEWRDCALAKLRGSRETKVGALHLCEPLSHMTKQWRSGARQDAPQTQPSEFTDAAVSCALHGATAAYGIHVF